MVDIKIVASVHIKSLDKNPKIVKAINEADLVIEEGVSAGNRWDSMKTEPLLFLYWEVFSRLPIFRDIKSSRKVPNTSRINVDTDFAALTRFFYKWYHGLINIILIVLIFIGLLFLPYIIIGIIKLDFLVVSAALFGLFLFGFLPVSTFFIYFLNKTSRYRNDLVVSKIKDIGLKYNKIVILYGAKHTKDLYNKLKLIDNCKIEIIKTC